MGRDPAPALALKEWIFHYYDELKAMLPGFCDSCLRWHIRRFEAPWGANPHMCQKCMKSSISGFNRTEWPDLLDFNEEI